jgi:hypothetical protein
VHRSDRTITRRKGPSPGAASSRPGQAVTIGERDLSERMAYGLEPLLWQYIAEHAAVSDIRLGEGSSKVSTSASSPLTASSKFGNRCSIGSGRRDTTCTVMCIRPPVPAPERAGLFCLIAEETVSHRLWSPGPASVYWLTQEYNAPARSLCTTRSPTRHPLSSTSGDIARPHSARSGSRRGARFTSSTRRF